MMMILLIGDFVHFTAQKVRFCTENPKFIEVCKKNDVGQYFHSPKCGK
jgi:hypothetical protein